MPSMTAKSSYADKIANYQHKWDYPKRHCQRNKQWEQKKNQPAKGLINTFFVFGFLEKYSDNPHYSTGNPACYSSHSKFQAIKTDYLKIQKKQKNSQAVTSCSKLAIFPLTYFPTQYYREFQYAFSSHASWESTLNEPNKDILTSIFSKDCAKRSLLSS